MTAMLVYVTPIVTLTGALLFVGMTCSKDEKQRAFFRLAVKIVGGIMGIGFVIMVIGFVSAFIRLIF